MKKEIIKRESFRRSVTLLLIGAAFAKEKRNKLSNDELAGLVNLIIREISGGGGWLCVNV
ncbi:hypothetical protein T4E_5185 [Trichinella pseudospiralis]|uniref:Uncharacterized protein n=1 Tax=Trichinella pseudospiralis TaxID=6337 RepID=A0A0V0Y9X9_TRIPS|nr:hypothetical protein T4E_5185 [Trichinella pseudospiralis]